MKAKFLPFYCAPDEYLNDSSLDACAARLGATKTKVIDLGNGRSLVLDASQNEDESNGPINVAATTLRHEARGGDAAGAVHKHLRGNAILLKAE